MNRKNIKKAVSVILLIVIVFSVLNLTVSARYNHITLISASLTIDALGLASCTGVVCPSDNDTNTTLRVELQKYSNSQWVYVDYWPASGSGMSIIRTTGYKYVVGGKYRVVVTAKVYSASGILLENESINSYEITY